MMGDAMSKSGAALLRRVPLIAAALILGDAARAEDHEEAAMDKPLATFDEHGLTLRSPDDSVNFHLGGRLHMDLGSGGSSGVTSEFDTAGIRRIWIEPKLTINKDLIFNLQYDPSSQTAPIDNLLLSYKGFGAFTLTGGNFKEPFSLDWLTSNNDIMFMERSLAQTFVAPGRFTGFAIGTHGENWTVSGGVFGGNINETVERGGIAGMIRATYAPILTSNEVLHFGVAGSYRSLDRRAPEVSFDTTPESFLFRTSLVDTGTIDEARAIGRLGFEFAWANGPFRMQAEYIATQVERAAGRDVTFQGGYMQAAWVINGKSPRYAVDADTATDVGVFKRVQPETAQRVSRGGVGVFEVAARYSAIDLTSGDIRGGFQQDATVGLNWYPEPFIRIMANYIRAWASPTAQSVTGRPAQADIGQVRLQIAF
jgi:phosphate-selective porin OprO and OprP